MRYPVPQQQPSTSSPLFVRQHVFQTADAAVAFRDTIALPTGRSITQQSSPLCAKAAPLWLLLAFSAGREAEPIGSLQLEPYGSGPYSLEAVSLRITAKQPEERLATAHALLRHAVHSIPELYGGGALLALPAHGTLDADADADAADELCHFGFEAAVPAEATGDDEREASGSMGAEGLHHPPSLLAYVERREATRLPDGSHAALRVSSIGTSLRFWSLLHFAPTRTFSADGARCALLSSPWTSLSLELIEVPPCMQCEEAAAAAGRAAAPTASSDDGGLGLAHLCLDVTPLGVGLESTLELLQARSEARFGQRLAVLAGVKQQMMGDLVAEVALVRAPDGMPLELMHRAGRLSGEMAPDWELP